MNGTPLGHDIVRQPIKTRDVTKSVLVVCTDTYVAAYEEFNAESVSGLVHYRCIAHRDMHKYDVVELDLDF